MEIILLNGPPYAGKDLFGSMLLNVFKEANRKAVIMKFDDPLTKGIEGLLGMTQTMLEPSKDDPIFPGEKTSYRQLKIHLSEEVMKPFFGEGIFGRLLAQRIKAHGAADYYIVTNSGFNCELPPLEQAFGAEHLHVVRIDRPGHTFDGDSREYVEPPTGASFYPIQNDGGLDALQRWAALVATQVFMQEDHLDQLENDPERIPF